MRMASACSKICLVIVLLTCAFLPLSPVCAGRKAHPKTPRVSVSVDEKAYRVGKKVKITVRNNFKETVSLAGCNTYFLEKFVEDKFVPMPLKNCDWEQQLIPVKEGVSTFEYSPPHSERAIVRVVVTYGLGCKEDSALSQAQCNKFDTAYSPTFVLLKAPE